MLQIKRAEFTTSVGLRGDYPEGGVPEIAVVGKSNVGKSSFINAVCNNKKLARTSQQPGKTRLVNYFSINGGEFYLVDLPGYGFAKAPKEEQEKWGELMETYLRSGRVNHLLLLVDSRHAPSAGDRQMMVWMQYYNIPYTIIATKVDKLPKSRRPQYVAAVAKSVGAVSPAIGFSADERIGLDEVLERMDQIVHDVALGG